jgi:hypothetical protein
MDFACRCSLVYLACHLVCQVLYPCPMVDCFDLIVPVDLVTFRDFVMVLGVAEFVYRCLKVYYAYCCVCQDSVEAVIVSFRDSLGVVIAFFHDSVEVVIVFFRDSVGMAIVSFRDSLAVVTVFSPVPAGSRACLVFSGFHVVDLRCYCVVVYCFPSHSRCCVISVLLFVCQVLCRVI